MIPPAFGDLGKQTRDLFEKKFKFGYITLDHKSKTSKAFELHLNGDHEVKSGKINAYVETTHKLCEKHDLSLTTKLDSKNALSVEVSANNFVPGVKKTVHVEVSPANQCFSITDKLALKRDYVNAALDVDLKPDCAKCTIVPPVVNASLVLGGCPVSKWDGIYLGGSISFDCQTRQLKKHILRAGYQKGNLGVVGNVLNNRDYQVWLYQKVNDQTKLGVDFLYNRDSQKSTFGLATQYDFDSANNSFVKAKVNSGAQLGLTYGFRLRDNVDAHVTSQLDTRDLQGGNHQFGVGIEFSG